MAGATGALPAKEADGDEDADSAVAAEAAGDDADASANEGADAADEVRSIGELVWPTREEEEESAGADVSGATVERDGEAAVGMGASSDGQYAALLRTFEVDVGDEAEEGREPDGADRGSGTGARDEECRAAAVGLPE